jgi:hypothetical protein
MTSVCESAAKRKTGSKPEPVRIENAGCPRICCNGDVYYDPATKRVYCPSCVRRQGRSLISTANRLEGGAL